MAQLGTQIAEKLITVIGTEFIKEICFMWGHKSKLEDLKDTISTIRDVLVDAQHQEELSNKTRNYIEKLKAVVYDADDFFDKFVTLAELKELSNDSNFSEKVRTFLSSSNPLSVAYAISQGVKKIRKKLDAVGLIANSNASFGIVVDCQPIRSKIQETCSYAYVSDVIGRENDLNETVDKLLSYSASQHDVSFLTVVGIGGLGKTTLAQLVFNDERVKTEFPIRLWACVSDQNGQEFDVKSILARILESASHERNYSSAMDIVQTKVGLILGGKKYLLVLDDVWNEDREKWLELRKFLMVGAAGSSILVTSRSKRTAEVVGNETMYELKGLSPENSWQLFEMTAFGAQGKHVDSPELVEVGKEIVKQCANVPLAIKVVGSLLFSQDKSKWQSFHDNGLGRINKGDNKIMSILKLSYRNLESPLKSCFAYCALFPKDFVISKRIVVRLWAAHGFILPFEEGQSIEDACEEYFTILLRRCFFQDVILNEYGEVVTFKIHDLMHDVAKNIAGNEICVMNCIPSNLEDKVRHLFHIGGEEKEITFTKSKVRSYVRHESESLFPLESLLGNWTCLRSLDLHDINIKTLPDSISKLMHLRYLDLSWNINLEALPNSITKIYNLETLDLSFCCGLKELPADLSKLVKLRHLDIAMCRWLRYMPSRMNKMTSLCTLTEFVVGDENSSKARCVGQLEDLLALVNLRGSITIHIRKNCGNNAMVDGSEGECRRLRNMKHLKEISIVFPLQINGMDFDHKPILEMLEPPPNIRVLELRSYLGDVLPARWVREGHWETFLPNLVKIYIRFCDRLQHLPSMRKFRHLKSLVIHNLTNVEYMEDMSICNSSSGSTSNSTSRVEEIIFFPSLKYLEMSGLDKLKGWWRGIGLDNGQNFNWQPSFTHLSHLSIKFCPNLISFPPCPTVKTLLLDKLNENLLMTLGSKVEIQDLGYLKSLPMEHIRSLTISENEIDDLSKLEEAFKSFSSLKRLAFFSCRNLKSLSIPSWKHLTSLESLKLGFIPELVLSDEDDLPWEYLRGSLRSLELASLPKLMTLPKGMQYLTSLESLSIKKCDNLKAIPEWISFLYSLKSLCISSCNNLRSFPEAMQNLASLQMLAISACPILIKRCEAPNGKDFPKIQHIPSISICET
ncbi:putative disease resistance protein RGA1 [Silene latifolia]|uniref:putative disease resistance protein RGA1 n=1 Tax=Silene latifolia TaxID=37657 RepID=UPI003D77F79F